MTRGERTPPPSMRQLVGSHHKWIVRLEGGPRRVNHAAVCVGKRIFSFGGFCTGEDYSEPRSMDVFILNTVTFRWSTLPVPEFSKEVPFMRYGHTVVAFEGDVYLWGGRNEKGACNTLFKFDTAASTWSVVRTEGVVPGARDGHSACLIRDKMYIFGGYEEDTDRFSNDVYSLDLKTMTWTYIVCQGTPPSHRDFHSATAIGDRMYIFGGRGDHQGPYHSENDVYCNRLAFLDTTNHRWNYPDVSGDMPSGRRSHSSFYYDKHIYIFGGYNSRRKTHFGAMYKFNPETNVWTEMNINVGRTGPPCPRRRQSSIIVGDRLFIFGGTSPVGLAQSHNARFELLNFNEQADHSEQLIDHEDTYVLDFKPTLRTLCLTYAIEHKLDLSCLPKDLQVEVYNMVTDNQRHRSDNNAG